MGIPETTYTSEITMNSGEFTKICKELLLISETVTIITTLEFVKFSVEGDIGNGSIWINTTTGEIDEGDENDDRIEALVKLSFALKYLGMFTKAGQLCNEVRLQMAPETPLVVEYNMTDLGKLSYYLAPKISDNEAED